MLGRADERRQIDEALRAAGARTSAGVALLGGPGVGKTTLLRLAAVTAADAGFHVAETVGMESEATVGFAGLYDLCRPFIDHLDALPPLQADALRAALALASTVPGDRFTVAVATTSLLIEVSRTQPVAVIVDDLHWLDAPTAEVVLFVARHLRSEPIIVLIGSRDDGIEHLDIRGLTVMKLEGLGEDDGVALVRQLAPSVDAAVARRLALEAAGNPAALTYLTSALSPDELAGLAPLPEPLPIGPRLGRALMAAIDPLPERAKRALLVAAAAPGAVEPVAAALEAADLSLEDLAPAEERGALALAPGSLSFAHPLLRSAVYRAATAAERREAHRLLAAAFVTRGDLVRQAWHRAAATVGADESVAADLERVAEGDVARGAPASAAQAWERAAALSPDPAEQARRLVTAAELWRLSDRGELAMRVVDRAMELQPPTAVRARILHLRGRSLWLRGSYAESRAVLEEGAAVAAPVDPALAARILLDAAVAVMRGGKPDLIAGYVRRAAELAPPGEPDLELLVTLLHGFGDMFGGDREAAMERLSRAEALFGDPRALVPSYEVVATVVETVAWVAADRGLAMLQALTAAARAAGMVAALPAVLATEALIRLRRLELEPARQLSSEAVRLGEATGQQATIHLARAVLARLEAGAGRIDEARALAHGIVADEAAPLRARVDANDLLAMIDLILGEPACAVQHAERVVEMLGGPANFDPALGLWEQDLVEAYARVGRRDEAIAALQKIEAKVDELRYDAARGALVRCRALLTEDDATAVALFEEAIDLHGGHPIATPRTRMCWADRLLDAGRADDAVQQLALAEQEAMAGGVPGLAMVARDRLAALGVRVAVAPVPLSPLQQQVATLREAGLSPVEIAERLFVSVAEVRRQWEATADHRQGKEGTRVVLLGDFGVERDGRPLPLPSASVQPLLALKYLAVRGGRATVDELVEALWPDAPPGRGRARLRNVLGRVREAVGDVIRRDGDVVALCDVTVDVAEFLDLVARAQAAGDLDEAGALATAAIDVYGGDLLPGDRFVDWTVAARERLRSRFVEMLDVAARAAVHAGDRDQAVRLLERVVAVEPLDESRLLAGARLLIELGRAGAARAWARRARAVVEELGVPASAELCELEQELGVRHRS